ncbi:MAG: DNA-directed RNA polymerase subunit alpha [Anaerolineae bacterium]|nr:DNA-directed RNA polymerase subunit alpha [Anaerolineae bacterium]
MLAAPVLPKVEVDVNTQKYGRYVIGPLEGGYGVTLGNSLRRVLLSSLEGAAITAMRVLDISHEFMAIPGVREDVIQMILRLKQIRLMMDGEGPQYMTLRVDGEGVVTAGDIIAPPEIEIINPDLYLFTVDGSDVHLDFEFTVEKGRGYLPSEDRGRLPIGQLPVDAIFSPVRRVAYQVDQARVGQLTNYDRLVMEIWTDGRVDPLDALKESARVLVKHLHLIAGAEIEPEAAETVVEEPEAEAIPHRAYAMPIEDLGLGVRVYNALKRTGISNVGEVLEMMRRGKDAMLAIRNFGEKSLQELAEQLELKGFLEEDDTEEDTGDEAE